jgi:sulfite reductase beta subunit-like hemoprotein
MCRPKPRRDELRKNRARARIKVLVDQIGADGLRALVEEELRGDWVNERDYSFSVEEFTADEESHALSQPAPTASQAPEGDADFQRFLATNVIAQRQAGFSTVEVRIPRGDLTPQQFRQIADLVREYSAGYARTTIRQNIMLRWVRDESVYGLWLRLREIGFDGYGADQIEDVVSCPGSDSCRLSITSSMGLNRAIEERMIELEIDDPLTRRIRIKISGCPNGCSQHHIADIGFYGASLKVGDRTLPAYVPHVGGRFERGEVAMGARLKVRLPAKRVPDAVTRWLEMYEGERQDDEAFPAFVDRVGTGVFEAAVADLALPVEYSPDTVDQFIDWNRTEEFAIARGKD